MKIYGSSFSMSTWNFIHHHHLVEPIQRTIQDSLSKKLTVAVIRVYIVRDIVLTVRVGVSQQVTKVVHSFIFYYNEYTVENEMNSLH